VSPLQGRSKVQAPLERKGREQQGAGSTEVWSAGAALLYSTLFCSALLRFALLCSADGDLLTG